MCAGYLHPCKPWSDSLTITPQVAADEAPDSAQPAGAVQPAYGGKNLTQLLTCNLNVVQTILYRLTLFFLFTEADCKCDEIRNLNEETKCSNDEASSKSSHERDLQIARERGCEKSCSR